MDTHTFDRLLDFIVTLDSKYDSSLPLNLVLCGDLNSRTSNMPDYVQDDSFNSSVLPDDYVPDINSNRYSQDTGRLNNGTMAQCC